jgi:chemosensory pili system protein ChpA (sensor histidine kinase/response regulator)
MSALSVADPQPLPLILIVEDHVDTRQMYAEFFSEQYTVLEAGDGSQALALMGERPPDIVITDLSLPGLDGFELVTRMRADPKLAAIPIICLSGYGGHAHETRAREAGCNRILQKPCMPDELAQAAADLLRDRSVGS